MLTSFIIQDSSLTGSLADIYIQEVVARHGMLTSMVFNRDILYTSRFWKRFHDDLGTWLYLSTTYHAQTNSQCERTIQTLEDM